LLRVKLWRDLRALWKQFFAVFAMSALCLAVFTGLEGGWRGMQAEQQQMDEQSGLADVWLSATSLSSEQLTELQQVPTVSAVEALDVFDASLIPNAGQTDLVIRTLPTHLNIPAVIDGSLEDNGLSMDARFAQVHSIEIGDTAQLQVNGVVRKFEVTALVLAADQVSGTGGDGLVSPDPQRYGYAYLPSEVIDADVAAFAHPQVSILLAGDPSQIQAAVSTVLGDAYLAFDDRSTLPSYAGLADRIQQIRNLSYLFLGLFIALAMLSMFSSMKRLVDLQGKDIATLKALGVPDTKLWRHHADYAIVVVGGGALLGLAVAPLLSRFVLSTQRASFALPRWEPAYTFMPVALLIALVAASIFVASLAARAARRASPATAMRVSVKVARRSGFERFGGLSRRWVPLSRWAVRDVSAARGRLVTGFGMPDSLHSQVQTTFERQYLYDVKARVAPGTLDAAGDDLVGRVDEAQWLMQFSALLKPRGASQLVTVLSAGDLYRLSERERRVELPNAGAVLSAAVAARLGIGVGDTVHVLPPASSREVTLRVEGFTDVGEPQGIFVSEQAWEAAGASFDPNYLLARGDNAEQALSGRDGVVSTLTHAVQQENAQQLLDSLQGVFTLIRVFGLLLTVVVLLNLGILAFAERTRDYATMKVLGVRNGEIRSLLLRENLTVTVIGMLLGIPAGFLFLNAYLTVFSTDRVVYAAAPSWVSTALCLALVLICGISTSLLLSRRIDRIDLTSTLKAAE